MNIIMENLLSRRSVRAFKSDDIPMEQLMEIAKTGVYAPSAMNRQTWKFTIVTNREYIRRLAETIEIKLERAGYNMYCPAALIIPSNHRETKWGREDNACALENMMLAAHSLGIGSVWLNQLQEICDEPKIRTLLDELQIPASHLVYGFAAFGYAVDGQPQKEVVKTGEIHVVN
ncbi:MAG: nitroreductase family protein [Lachnospiraceae bacterium]